MSNIRIEDKISNDFSKLKSRMRSFLLFGKMNKFERTVRLSEVTIDKGAVVSKSVAPYTVVGDVLAKEIGTRK